MNQNVVKTSLIFIVFLYFSSCGFKPIYKLSESDVDLRSYTIKIANEDSISREIKEEIRKYFPPNSVVERDFVIKINIIENLDPLITNTDGTIAKYRIEIIMNFEIIDKTNNSYLVKDVVRGFAQYDVETSEIENYDKERRMRQTATSNAIQMMISKIQSDPSITNDN